MPNYQGVWDITTQFQYAAEWQASNLIPAIGLVTGFGTNNIDKILIASSGNATDFGDMSYTAAFTASLASSVRGIMAGDNKNESTDNSISFVTISTDGNAADFGDMTVGAQQRAGASNNTRGLFAGEMLLLAEQIL